MTKKSRFMTGLLAVVLAFVMLSSVAYIAAESDHDCTGVDCAICHQILCRIIPSCSEVVRTFTLVSLKVKLSD